MLAKIPIKTEEEIKLMRAACRVTAEILRDVESIIRPGVTTEQINSFVHQRITAAGGYPSTLNYRGFPKSCCTSINDVICHGIPSPLEVLKGGDLINVDVTTFLGGYHGDASKTYFVGGRAACSTEAQELVDITLAALMEGIAVVRPGAHVGDIGAAIQSFIRNDCHGYGIVKEYTGHGVGRDFHEAPQVMHVGRVGTGEKLLPGMTFTIEPMINVGSSKTVLSKVDGWTVRTADGKLSAQFEHTVLVTPTGVEILTQL